MNLHEFRRWVRREFGGNLQYLAQPRDGSSWTAFQDHVDPGPNRRYVLNEPENSYEAIVRNFLRESLEMPTTRP